MSKVQKTGGKKWVGAQALGHLVPGLIAPAARKFGFSSADLIGQWAAIVGADIAERCAPDRIAWPRTAPDPLNDAGKAAATLHVRAQARDVLHVSHETNVIAERLNAYFGYCAIDRVIVHRTDGQPGHMGEAPQVSLLPPATDYQPVDGVHDEALADALGELGGHVRRDDDGTGGAT